jgi:hypothetical protein
MLLNNHDGTVTDTNEYRDSRSRYHDPLSVYLDWHMTQSGDLGDDFAGDFTTVGCAYRFGRRLLNVQTTGFMYVDTYASPEEAESVLYDMFPDDEMCDA